MEISSAVCFNHTSSSSILHAPFSNQSHLHFYHRSNFFTPSKLCIASPFRSATSPVSVAPLRALADNVCDSVFEEQALMKELADLKLQMKQKKKELKARMKGRKGELKIEMKRGKELKKQNDVSEGKTKKKKKCSADSSSSSSESSDGECESVSMKILRHGQIAIEDPRRCNGEGICAPCKDDDIVVCGRSSSPTSGLSRGVTESCTEVLFSGESVGDQCRGQVDTLSHESMTRETLLPSKKAVGSLSGFMSNVFHTVHSTNRIEVCAGGKCKRAGSEQLLSALRGQIPRALDVEAVPCKCMGKCSSVINVRVHKEDTNPQHHSHVGVDDAHLILNHHFGRPSALPSALSKEGMPALSPLAIG